MRNVLLSVLLCLALAAGAQTFDNTLVLPPCRGMAQNIGVAGAFGGVVGGNVIAVGGANFPDGYPWDGGRKTWWRTLYAYSPRTGQWAVQDDFLPEAAAYGVSITLPEGVLCIGGTNGTACSRRVWLLDRGARASARRVSGSAGFCPRQASRRAEARAPQSIALEIDSLSFPQLPVPLAFAAGALVGHHIYIAGGQEAMQPERSTSHFFCLDLRHKERGWQELPTWPGPPRGYAVAAAAGGEFYLFSGRSYGPDEPMTVHTDGYAYNPQRRAWRRLDGVFPVMAATAAATGRHTLMLLGGVERLIPGSPQHPGFSRTVRTFDATQARTVATAQCPYPIAATTTAVACGDTIYIMSGETMPGIRTPHILRIKP